MAELAACCNYFLKKSLYPKKNKYNQVVIKNFGNHLYNPNLSKNHQIWNSTYIHIHNPRYHINNNWRKRNETI